jgi:hypothetical protein
VAVAMADIATLAGNGHSTPRTMSAPGEGDMRAQETGSGFPKAAVGPEIEL